MPRYLATHHAVDRLLERVPAMTQIAGHGATAARWLAQAASMARVAAQQTGRDLLLCLDLPVPGHAQQVYLPVTPHARDTWVIRTVLTHEQAVHNLVQCQAARRAAWREHHVYRHH